MRSIVQPLLLVVLLHVSNGNGQRLQPPRQYYQIETSDDEPPLEVVDDIEIVNLTERGMYLGSPCDFTCSPKLHHVFCDPVTGHCECEKKYPVKLSATTGCGKAKKLGEQCLYRESCSFSDQHSSCIQIHHNAVCQCLAGYHAVSLQRPTKRVFCAEDLELLTSNFSALAGVATGIAVLTGLLCFVLRLFTHAKSPRPRHFANANLAPPILFSSDTGIPLTVQSSGGRSTSRASSQRTFVSTTYSRRASRASSAQGSRGVLVSASRAGAARAAAILLISCHVSATVTATATTSATASAGGAGAGAQAQSPESPNHHPSRPSGPSGTDTQTGSRRPSLASVHSSGSSVKSYSAKRFEKEREQKEEREMQIRLSRMHSNSTKPPTPSPQSTDELLPSVLRQVPLAIEEECASTSFQNDIIGPGTSREFH